MGGVSRGGSRAWRRRWSLVLSLTMLLGLTAPAHAEEGFFEQAGIGAGTALVNVLYIPAKFTYATVGGLIGGLAWVLTLGDTDTAMGVWEPTMGGSYVITPSMLRGDTPIEFSGESSAPASGGEEVFEETEEVEIREYDEPPSDR